MTLIEIMEYCNGNLMELDGSFSMRLLVEELYRGKSDVEELTDFLGELNARTRRDFDQKLEAWLMDSRQFMPGPKERLMYRLRLENAIFALQFICGLPGKRTQPQLHLDTRLLEEALLWAMTSLWDFSYAICCHRAARAYFAGLDTILVPRIPGSVPPHWMN